MTCIRFYALTGEIASIYLRLSAEHVHIAACAAGLRSVRFEFRCPPKSALSAAVVYRNIIVAVEGRLHR